MLPPASSSLLCPASAARDFGLSSLAVNSQLRESLSTLPMDLLSRRNGSTAAMLLCPLASSVTVNIISQGTNNFATLGALRENHDRHDKLATRARGLYSTNLNNVMRETGFFSHPDASPTGGWPISSICWPIAMYTHRFKRD